MGAFKIFALLFCVFGVAQCLDFNFWLGVPSSGNINPKLWNTTTADPIQLYTCAANLLCHLGKDAPNIMKACNNLALNGTSTDQSCIWGNFFWTCTLYRSVTNTVNTILGYIIPFYSSEPKLADNPQFDMAREEFCNMPVFNQYHYISMKYFEAINMYKTAGSRDEFYQSYPAYNCTLTANFDLPLFGKCGDRNMYKEKL